MAGGAGISVESSGGRSRHLSGEQWREEAESSARPDGLDLQIVSGETYSVLVKCTVLSKEAKWAGKVFVNCPMGCWEPNSGPIQEQQALYTNLESPEKRESQLRNCRQQIGP